MTSNLLESKRPQQIESFRDLKIWQFGMSIVERVYNVTANFPQSEVYALTSQMRRAAVSIPSNISEGFRRQHSKEYKQFLNIALGSCGELETQVEIAKRLGYLLPDACSELTRNLEELCKMIHGLLRKI